MSKKLIDIFELEEFDILNSLAEKEEETKDYDTTGKRSDGYDNSENE